MTTMTEKTTHVAEAQANLIDQFRNHTNIDALTKAVAQQVQDLETAAFDVITETLIATGIGQQLDNLGTVIGVERAGRTDDAYRVRLAAQILLNNSSGTIEELLEIAVTLGATSVVLTPAFPAKMAIDVGASLADGAEIGNILGLAKKAGVGLAFTWFESALPFEFDTAGQGFDQGQLGEMLAF